MVLLNSEHFHIPQLLRLTIIMWRHHQHNFQQFLSVISIFCPLTENLKLEILRKYRGHRSVSGVPSLCRRVGSAGIVVLGSQIISHQNFVNRPILVLFRLFHVPSSGKHHHTVNLQSKNSILENYDQINHEAPHHHFDLDHCRVSR